MTIVGGVATGLILYTVLGGNGSGQSQPPSAGASAGGCGASTEFRFDDLGDTSLHLIEVYPGIRTTATDKTYDGTFPSGESVGVYCKKTGRVVRSDPSAGERPRTSDMWVRLAPATPVRYATVVYGEISPASLARLPTCVG